MLDVECKSGWVCGLLYGVLVLIKDNVEIVDVMLIIVGSFVLKDNLMCCDVLVVVWLWVVGVVILGKINFSEWVNICLIWLISGWSVFGG